MNTIIRWLYSLVLFLASPLLLRSLYKKKEGKPSFGKRWKEHFGLTPKLRESQQPIWIHAVSVGEAIAATPIIKALKQKSPEQPILVTTTTSTGAAQIEKLGDLVEHRYMPIDFSFAVRGFLKAVRPSKMLIMETELWPNTLHCVAKQSIQISVLNARLSEKSYLNYRKVQPIFNLLARNLSNVFCQYQDDAERFVKLGLPSEQVHLTGSVKFDVDVNEDTLKKGKKLRQQLGLNRPVWIAASTHKGEDEQVLSAHSKLLKSIPNALLILVPRHPERFSAVTELSEEQGFQTIRRTSATSVDEHVNVYMGDTMGEMLTLIGASDICFMGGSLIGEKVGGHNLLEPAALKKPSITGPSYYNFLEITEALIENNATIVIDDSEQLSKTLIELMQDQTRASEMGENASQFVANNSGAISKTLALLEAQQPS